MAASRVANPNRSQEAFLSEVFHSLSQPLTALHCTLDLALQHDRTAQQLRASVQSALDNAERLRRRLLLIRALQDAENPGDTSELVDVNALLRELCDDMSPLFESTGRKLELQIAAKPLPVRADKARLLRGLFVFLEYLFRYLPEGATLSVILDRIKGRGAEICIEGPCSLPVGPDDGNCRPTYSCEAELVRRTFKAAGGEFALTSYDSDGSAWLGTLPLH
jgi:signal transduction histidine kinase